MAKRELEIIEIKEDPGNDAALGVMIDIRGPFEEYAMVMVYFTEEFMEKYFDIRWFKDLPREEAQLIRRYREDFIRWSLAKVEEWVRKKNSDTKIIVDYETDAVWARKVQEGTIKIQSRKESGNTYIFER